MPIDWSRGKPLHIPQPSSSVLDPDTGKYVDVTTIKNPETGGMRSVAKDGSGKIYDWGTPTAVNKPQQVLPSPQQMPSSPSQTIGAPTGSKQTGRFAGAKLGGMLGHASKGLAFVDAGFDVASLTNSDQEGKERAREMAMNLVDQGYTNYDAVMALAQSNPGLESAIGDIGMSDYAKTIAGVGLQAGDVFTAGPLGIGTGILGAVARIDLQRKKGKRNEAFREQFANELIERGLA